jgi:hypothetical protein
MRMLKNGRYAVWFKTPRGEGTGMVTLNNGVVFGRDSVLAYSGAYRVKGDEFTAAIMTRRHAPGQPSLFGIDDLDLALTGTSMEKTAVCTGTARQAPELSFHATLLKIEDEG